MSKMFKLIRTFSFITRTIPKRFNSKCSVSFESKQFNKNLVLTIPLSQKQWIWEEGLKINTPSRNNIINNLSLPTPVIRQMPIITPKVSEFIETPAINKPKMEAARLIVIRRRKMKKHKLRKLRIRMKFEWAKVRQRRELKKEKLFQAGLIAQIKEAEKFSAEQYVADKIRQATEKPLPRFWKGRRLPAFIIRQKLGLDKLETKKN